MIVVEMFCELPQKRRTEKQGRIKALLGVFKRTLSKKSRNYGH